MIGEVGAHFDEIANIAEISPRMWSDALQHTMMMQHADFRSFFAQEFARYVEMANASGQGAKPALECL